MGGSTTDRPAALPEFIIVLFAVRPSVRPSIWMCAQDCLPPGAWRRGGGSYSSCGCDDLLRGDRRGRHGEGDRAHLCELFQTQHNIPSQ